MPQDRRLYDFPQRDGRLDLSNIDLHSLSPQEWDDLRRQIFRQARIERDRAIRIAIGTVLGWVWRGFWRLLRWCRLRAAWISHVRKRREQVAAAELRGTSDQGLADMGLTRGDIENRVRFRARRISLKPH
jgi:uncharacterized protein YjiS (DUF1127 family)